MRKRTSYSLAGVGILVLLLTGLLTRGGNHAVDVKIEEVRPHDLISSVTASGKVEPHTRVNVSADITGRITRLAVKEGDVVSRGQFLLEIDPSQYQAAVERARAAVDASRAQAAQTQANLLQAQHAYDRTAGLKQRNPRLVSDEQIEQLRTAVTVNQAAATSAQHNIAESEASLRDAQSSLAKTTIVAPIAGRVTRLIVEQGETAIMGTLNKDAATLLTISDMTDLETKVKIDETDVSRINIGDSASVQLEAYPDTTFRGRVTDISNSSSASDASQGLGAGSDQTTDYQVTVRLLDAPHNVRPGFSATARIITDVRSHVLAIPIIALTVRENSPASVADSAAIHTGRQVKSARRKDIEGVFIVGKGKAVAFRPIQVGITGEEYFEVLSGVREGERVVSGPYQAIRTLQDGMIVSQGRSELAQDSTKR